MDENKKSPVPFIIYEDTLAREERHSKRIMNVLVLVMVLWFLTIAGFIWYITLPTEEVSTEYTQTMDGIDGDNVHQQIGDIDGKSEANSP